MESTWGLPWTFNFALDSEGFTWNTNTTWYAQGVVYGNGLSALRSGSVGDNGVSAMQTTVDNGGEVVFRYRTSCENGSDFLRFYIDGVQKFEATGDDGEWRTATVPISRYGRHVLIWQYEKDASGSAGADCAWVDQVEWVSDGRVTATSGAPVPFDWLDSFGLVAGGNYEAAALADADGDNLAAWQEYVAGTCPTSAASVLTISVAVADGSPVLTWSPDLKEERVYTIEGKASLDDSAWSAPANAASRFFRVKVSMPK